MSELEVQTTKTLLAGSLRLTVSCLPYTAQAYLPRDGTTHSGLGPSISIFNQETTSKTCPQANLMESTPKLRLPKIMLGCVRLAAEAD